MTEISSDGQVATISFRFADYPINKFGSTDWADKYLGNRVEFTLCGHKFTGEVVEAEQFCLCNGTHDILTVEVEHERKQVKVQLHRQAVRLLQEGGD